MNCPKCGSSQRTTIDSRLAESGEVRRRRYCCNNCHYRYSTAEIVTGQMKTGPRAGLSKDEVFDQLVAIALPRAKLSALLKEALSRTEHA